MFFPDRPWAYAQNNRVLWPGGTFVFKVWDDIANNEFAAAVTDAVGESFADDPPLFLARTPHVYHDEVMIRSDLAASGFAGPRECRAVGAPKPGRLGGVAKRARTARHGPARRSDQTRNHPFERTLRIVGTDRP